MGNHKEETVEEQVADEAVDALKDFFAGTVRRTDADFSVKLK